MPRVLVGAVVFFAACALVSVSALVKALEADHVVVAVAAGLGVVLGVLMTGVALRAAIVSRRRDP